MPSRPRSLAHLLARDIRIEEDLVDQLFNSAEKRLARMLLLLASFGKEGKPAVVISKISQDTLATMNCIALALINAQRGRMRHGVAFAGENAHRATAIHSVKDLVATLLDEYHAAAACPAAPRSAGGHPLHSVSCGSCVASMLVTMIAGFAPPAGPRPGGGNPA